MKNIEIVEKILRIVIIAGIAIVGILDLIYVAATDFWCTYMQVFETGTKYCFRASYVCLFLLLIIKGIKKYRDKR